MLGWYNGTRMANIAQIRPVSYSSIPIIAMYVPPRQSQFLESANHSVLSFVPYLYVPGTGIYMTNEFGST